MVYSSGNYSVFDSPGWNNHWKTEFGLADIQFSSEQLSLLDRFTTRWSRDNAASYMLKPTLDNALLMGLSEGLSQWTNPELVVAGLSVGMAGVQGATRTNAFRQSPEMNPNAFHVTPGGIVLRKGDIIPANFMQNQFRAGSYGIEINGKYVEKIRIDGATPIVKKEPNFSYFHMNQSGKHQIYEWPYK